jgi:hypothetical protein
MLKAGQAAIDSIAFMCKEFPSHAWRIAMHCSLRVLALTSFALFALKMPGPAQPVEGIAQLPEALTPAEHLELKTDIAVATRLIRMGRERKDAHALLVALRILSGLGSPVALPRPVRAGEKPAMFDLVSLVAEAKGYALGDQALLDALAAVSLAKPQHSCYWAWECNDVACDRFYTCVAD